MNVIVYGNGAMGQLVAQSIQQLPDAALVAVVSPQLEASDINVLSSLKEVKEKADVIIDFSHPDNLEKILDYALAQKVAVIFCTTGYDEAALTDIQSTAQQIPILLASNTSLGVNLLHQLLQQAVRALAADFDIEIIEQHHNKKLDAPSGTANSLLDTIQDTLAEEREVVYGRSGLRKRGPTEIGMHSLRGGTIVGEHSIIFAGEDEVIELRHSAQSKKVFAQGAIRAARFLMKQEAGFYEMGDVLK
ncbi:MAG: 4-hydroxy-tetrahydrodipicolinate reductase [Bacteroidota bacterium]